ncbi:hypothetical protein [Streptomyces sp. HPF1205]|uniref:hypothetical protein n=1 Tax=Streptomyces sp. HPF1205 TaxID=2873262 RepID=UPI001CECA5FA|nr:hypothetical protein [Streptomyces sp. HPF1205]
MLSHPHKRSMTMTLTAAVATVALGACGGHTGNASSANTRPTPTAGSAARTGGAGHDLLVKALKSMHTATSMTLDVRGSGSGAPVHSTSTVTQAGDCVAAVEQNGAHIRIIDAAGTFYMKAGLPFWTAQLPAHKAFARGLADKWAIMPQNGYGSGFDQYCKLAIALTPLDVDATAGKVTRSPAITYHGQRLIPLVHTSPQGTVTHIYVATSGTPYILRVENSGIQTSTTQFSGFGTSPRISPPPADETIDPSKH